MQFTMAIRNKILQAYTEVSQMQFRGGRVFA
jgi:flagellar hook-basal body complex protein FliE